MSNGENWDVKSMWNTWPIELAGNGGQPSWIWWVQKMHFCPRPRGPSRTLVFNSSLYYNWFAIDPWNFGASHAVLSPKIRLPNFVKKSVLLSVIYGLIRPFNCMFRILRSISSSGSHVRLILDGLCKCFMLSLISEIFLLSCIFHQSDTCTMCSPILLLSNNR